MNSTSFCDIEEKNAGSRQPDEEWKFWLPVTSTITDAELQEFENRNWVYFPR
jgi:hypothetical protein